MIFYVSSLMVLYSYDICVLCMLPYFVDKHMQIPYVFFRLLFLFENERYVRVRKKTAVFFKRCDCFGDVPFAILSKYCDNVIVSQVWFCIVDLS